MIWKVHDGGSQRADQRKARVASHNVASRLKKAPHAGQRRLQKMARGIIIFLIVSPKINKSGPSRSILAIRLCFVMCFLMKCRPTFWSKFRPTLRLGDLLWASLGANVEKIRKREALRQSGPTLCFSPSKEKNAGFGAPGN